jgi:hypothetical protein
MDDLFRIAKIPVFQKYTVISEFKVVHPWDPICIYNELEIAINNRKQFTVRLKRLYGNG